MYQLRSDSGRGQMCPLRSVTWLSPGSTLPSLIQARGNSWWRRETTGRALKYIAAGCGHMSLVSTGKLSSELTIITILRTKTAARSSLAPGYKYWQQNIVHLVLVKNTNWSIDLSRVSVRLPHSGWRVFYLFHEFPFILSRTEPSRAELKLTRTWAPRHKTLQNTCPGHEEKIGAPAQFLTCDLLSTAWRKADFLSKQYLTRDGWWILPPIFCCNNTRNYSNSTRRININLNNWTSINILIWKSLINLTYEWGKINRNQLSALSRCCNGRVSHSLSSGVSLSHNGNITNIDNNHRFRHEAQ